MPLKTRPLGNWSDKARRYRLRMDGDGDKARFLLFLMITAVHQFTSPIAKPMEIDLVGLAKGFLGLAGCLPGSYLLLPVLGQP